MSSSQLKKSRSGNGRPDVLSQLHLKKKLRKCFEEGLAASTASKRTETNIKTACKYYQEWAREIEQAQNADFLERQKQDRAQTIVSYDMQIEDTGKMLEQIDEDIERFQTAKKSIPKHLMGYKIEFMKFRSSLVERKTAFIMQPTTSSKHNISSTHKPTGKPCFIVWQGHNRLCQGCPVITIKSDRSNYCQFGWR